MNLKITWIPLKPFTNLFPHRQHSQILQVTSMLLYILHTKHSYINIVISACNISIHNNSYDHLHHACNISIHNDSCDCLQHETLAYIMIHVTVFSMKRRHIKQFMRPSLARTKIVQHITHWIPQHHRTCFYEGQASHLDKRIL